jgi:lactate permease
VLVPFWLIWAFAAAAWAIWPAILVAGVSFAVPQYLVSNFHGPWLVDVIAPRVSMVCLTLFLRCGSRTDLDLAACKFKQSRATAAAPAAGRQYTARAQGCVPRLAAVADPVRARLPVGHSAWKKVCSTAFRFKIPMAGLHNLVQKMPPVVPQPMPRRRLHAQLAVRDRHRHPAVASVSAAWSWVTGA